MDCKPAVIRAARPPRAQNAEGFVLVAVLWILGGLATLAAIYAVYVVNAAASLSVNNDRLQVDASLSGALELTAYYLKAVDPAARPSSGTFSFPLGANRIAVGFVSEAARIDLNAAPKPLLAGLFRVLGAAPDSADYYADRIVGWRARSSEEVESRNKERAVYRAAGVTYDPREAPFTNVQELWLVLGLPPALVERAMPYVTVFSGLPSVNVIDAAPEALAALPGMSPDRLYDLLNRRAAQPVDPEAILASLGAVREAATAKPSKAYRVRVEVGLAQGRRVTAEAVILLLEDGPDPYRVLSWTDGFDG
jgi:general secretion pathway protein K